MDPATCDNAWELFKQNIQNKTTKIKKNKPDVPTLEEIKRNCSDLYISTTTIIMYLNTEINLLDIFPNIQLLNYHEQKEGVVKKLMKYNFTSEKEANTIIQSFDKEKYCIIDLLKKNHNPIKITYKISIGLSAKDIYLYKKKKKGAFYNCFVIILRLSNNDGYKEYHVKIFNTGKIEIPGMRTDSVLKQVTDMIIQILKPFLPNIKFTSFKDTVLMNSNFNCGFYLNRSSLTSILKQKYHLSVSYDPCSYPGIMCKFYYNDKIQDGIEKKDIQAKSIVSFMIFRTGSILIVGKCSKEILYYIYNFIKDIILKEYPNIFCGIKKNDIKEKKPLRKRSIIVYK
tara:strand:- start:1503 stop:2525 length:1023 start_codon:yes stop_codon:yes gene_type:complete